MKNIITPISRDLIKQELTQDKWCRNTNFGNRSIYIISHLNAPQTMQEIGRLREISFRDSGGGTGKSIDIDDFDISKNPYKQLIVWDNDDEQIVGGYRYLEGPSITFDENNVPNIATAELFHMSDEFKQQILPHTIELGRSFIQPAYQAGTDPRKGLFSLDNLWDGLGALVVNYPKIKYFFGKITMYTSFNVEARDLILYFMQRYYPDTNAWVNPIKPVLLQTDPQKLEATFSGQNLEEAFKTLQKSVRVLGENVPPLISAYMKLSSSMKSFGTAINTHFGGVEETAILITISDIYSNKKERHIQY